MTTAGWKTENVGHLSCARPPPSSVHAATQRAKTQGVRIADYDFANKAALLNSIGDNRGH